MRAMILAAGLGKRMRPLTNKTPKPLLKAGGKYLIVYHIERLAKAGFTDLVINTHWLGEQLPEALGNGERWGVHIAYSHEQTLLETAGGIAKALPLLTSQDNEDEPFLVVNGDIFIDLDLSAWLAEAPSINHDNLAHLALVDNPDHNPEGDFILHSSTGKLLPKIDAHDDRSLHAYTYSGLGLYHPSLFTSFPQGPYPLAPVLRKAIASGKVSGQVLPNYWLDVGTPERLEELNARLIHTV